MHWVVWALSGWGARRPSWSALVEVIRPEVVVGEELGFRPIRAGRLGRERSEFWATKKLNRARRRRKYSRRRRAQRWWRRRWRGRGNCAPCGDIAWDGRWRAQWRHAVWTRAWSAAWVDLELVIGRGVVAAIAGIGDAAIEDVADIWKNSSPQVLEVRVLHPADRTKPRRKGRKCVWGSLAPPSFAFLWSSGTTVILVHSIDG